MTFNLNDKYTTPSGKFVLSGIQAIVKLSFIQKLIDEQRGLDTAGYITGYRGSPLGGRDHRCLGFQPCPGGDRVALE